MTNRYARQILLPELGDAGQARLAVASVLVVGAGGLGCPVLQYLAGAGVNRIVVVDHDTVDQTNLHRQPLYSMADIGTAKAEAARRVLAQLNPGIAVQAVVDRLTPQNAALLVAAADVVVDAADSFAVTYILSDTCRAAAKPLVSASAVGMAGYVGAFCGGVPSYRAVFPDVPAQAGDCATLGVLGTVVAVLGGLQAHFVLNLVLGLAPSALGRIVTFDARRMAFGGFGFEASPEPVEWIAFITASDVTGEDLVVDLRSLAEAPVSPFEHAQRFGPDDVEAIASAAAPGQRVVLACRSGQRALRGASRLKTAGLRRLALVALGD